MFVIGQVIAGQCWGDPAAALLALRNKYIPPTINCEELDPEYGLDLVREEARPLMRPVVLIGGRGSGGANVVLAIKITHGSE